MTDRRPEELSRIVLEAQVLQLREGGAELTTRHIDLRSQTIQ